MPKWTVTSCAGTVFYNTLLKKTLKGRKDEKEDVISYAITLNERENTGILRGIRVVRSYKTVERRITNEKIYLMLALVK